MVAQRVVVAAALSASALLLLAGALTQREAEPPPPVRAPPPRRARSTIQPQQGARAPLRSPPRGAASPTPPPAPPSPPPPCPPPPSPPPPSPPPPPPPAATAGALTREAAAAVDAVCAGLPCSSACCINRALSAEGWEALGRRLRAGRLRQLSVAGNSVARANDYLMVRTLTGILSRGGGGRVSHTHALVRGGMHPEHLYHCGTGGLAAADGILVEYDQFTGQRHAEDLLRFMLAMPHHPALLIMTNCDVTDFNRSEIGGFRGYKGSHALPKMMAEWSKDVDDKRRIRHLEGPMLAHYRVARVHMCGAYRALLHNECPEERRYSSFAELWRDMFAGYPGGGDWLHPGPTGSKLRACLAARGVLRAAAQADAGEPPPTELPAPFLPDTLLRPEWPAFCLTAGPSDPFLGGLMGSRLVPSANHGWTRRTARGGEKQWLQAQDVGASIEIPTPVGATTLHMQHYVHHNLGMGLARVTVTRAGGGEPAAQPKEVDGCCPADCVPGLPGQGIYAKTLIADGLSSKHPHVVRVQVISRTAPSPCTTSGNKFDLVGILGSRPSEQG
eukprot:TRINITY_DN15999_c1_g3_i2.p1 TRINITY_DN15999_c1_g3~~TRINITY_DN15999_c1_g3_i2.p1  ORF type:complete len:559 (+),score=98.30 TRINITY_DN15999_c1_g3_i2:55-1731(+)